jgi:hypothetical protein
MIAVDHWSRVASNPPRSWKPLVPRRRLVSAGAAAARLTSARAHAKSNSPPRTPAVNAAHSRAVKASFGPAGSLESRTAIRLPISSTAAPALAQYDAERMRAMAAELTAHGLTTHLTDSRAGLDLTATLSPSGKREAELILDEDGYAELRYWNPPGTPPAQVTATALRALQAVTGTPPGPGPNDTDSAPGSS